MPLVPAKCTSCGGVLSIDQDKDAAVCPYCGNAFIVEKAIQNFSATYVINNIQADTVIMNGGQKDFDISAGTLKKYRGEDVNVTIPDNVDRIGSGAFAGLNIQSVTIPASVEEIDVKAFYGCQKLRQVNFSKGLLVIREEAFAYCENIEKLDIPEGVFLESRCFAFMNGLVELRLTESSVRTDGVSCFASELGETVDTRIYIDGKRLFLPSKYAGYDSFFRGCQIKSRSRMFSADTIADAVKLACRYWNCDEKDIRYDVKQEPKKTAFTSKDAKIEAEYIGE